MSLRNYSESATLESLFKRCALILGQVMTKLFWNKSSVINTVLLIIGFLVLGNYHTPDSMKKFIPLFQVDFFKLKYFFYVMRNYDITGYVDIYIYKLYRN